MKKNLIFAVCVLAVACMTFVLFRAGRADGSVARVDITNADTLMLALNHDEIYHIDTGALPVTLEVQSGRIRFIESICPDHVCESYGWLSKEFDQAICLPAGVVVSIEQASGV